MEPKSRFDFSYFDEILSKGLKLAIFDVEGTLVNSKVTDYYVYIKKKKTTSALLHKIWKLKTFLIFGLYWLCLDKIDRSLFQCSFYKKLSRISFDELSYYGKHYFEEYLNNRFILYTHDLLFYLKNKGIEVILLSTAIDPVIKQLADYFSTPYTCIRVRSDQDNYIDVLHIKDFKIHFISQFEAETMMVIADSKHDLEILRYSRYPVIVAKKERNGCIKFRGN